MKYLSVCSGIEAATVAWDPLGWKPFAFSEIDIFPSKVLAHHYPDVTNFGDMTKFKEWPDANVDVLVGGTPCQSFSVAGLRKGLDDPRGNLMLTYLAIAAKYRPRWLVWENVHGVLSSNGGKDFGTLLGGLGELGYGFAYRVLDAQYFKVPQSRCRVFVVGCLGDWRSAAAVLFERHSLSGHPPPRREKGESITHPIAPCLTSSGRGVERAGDTRGQDAVVATYRMVAFGDYSDDGAASALKARDYKDATDLISYGSGGENVLMQSMAVRRLTPTECARLQGFPDDYLSQVPGSSDSTMYKALGNSMAVPCMAWVGQRIQQVSELEGMEIAA